MTTQTTERHAMLAQNAELPELKRTPCLKCDDGFIHRGNPGKSLCPACYGATYVISEKGQS